MSTTLYQQSLRHAASDPQTAKSMVRVARRALAADRSKSIPAHERRRMGELLSARPVKLSQLKPKPDKKAGLRYYKKVRTWRIQQAFKALDGKVPDEIRDRTVAGLTFDYLSMLEDDRSSSWAQSEEQIFEGYGNPKTAVLWRQLKNTLKTHSSSATGLRDEVKQAMEKKDDAKLLAALLKAGLIADYEVKKLAETHRRSVESADPEKLEKYLKALKPRRRSTSTKKKTTTKKPAAKKTTRRRRTSKK